MIPDNENGNEVQLCLQLRPRPLVGACGGAVLKQVCLLQVETEASFQEEASFGKGSLG